MESKKEESPADPLKLLDKTLPIELLNRNQGQGHHWISSHKTRKQMEQTLRLLGMTRQPFEVPVRVGATRILGKGKRLWDSSSVLRGTYKQLEDSLVACGWFHDDSTKFITETIGRQDSKHRSTGPAVRIQVYQDDPD
jgi:hypothetical protein